LSDTTEDRYGSKGYGSHPILSGWMLSNGRGLAGKPGPSFATATLSRMRLQRKQPGVEHFLT